MGTCTGCQRTDRPEDLLPNSPGFQQSGPHPIVKLPQAPRGGALVPEAGKYTDPRTVGTSPPDAAADFVSRVYGVLTAQTGLMSFSAVLVQRAVGGGWLQEHVWLQWVTLVGMVLFVLGAASVCRGTVQRSPANVLFLGAFGLLAGACTGFVWAFFAVPAVALAAGCTAGIFFVTSLFVLLTRTDYSGTTPYTFTTFCGLTAMGVVLLFVNVDLMQKLLGGAAAQLFTWYTAFHLQRAADVVRRYPVLMDEYLTAALGLYLDGPGSFGCEELAAASPPSSPTGGRTFV